MPPVFRGGSKILDCIKNRYLLWTNDSQLFHSRFQGSRFQAENFRCATLAANAPAGVLKDVLHMAALYFVQVLLCENRRTICFGNLSPENRSRIEDEISLDYIAK